MGRGTSKAGGGKGGTVSVALTNEQMQSEMNAEFERINKTLDDFLEHNPKNKSLDEFDADLPHIEKDSIANLKKNYIDEYNSNVKNFGNGFEYYDEDQSIAILYKDGNVVNVLPGISDGSQRIATSNIDSIIIDSGWGTAVAGKHIKLENYRETVGYGKYGYDSVKQRYDDFNDIRADFTVGKPKR